MVLCFNKKINSFCEKNLKSCKNYNEQNSYIQSLMPDITNLHTNKCPCCHSKNKLIRYGTYNRNLSILIDDNIVKYNIYVQRVLCNSCGSTHALLPNFIIPYKSMAIFSIAKIVYSSVVSSAYKVSEKIDSSWQQIYNLVAIVLAFFMDFKILNNSKNYYCIRNFNVKYFLTNCVFFSDSKYRLDFFEFHNWILFMQKFRNNSSPPIHISISKSIPT